MSISAKTYEDNMGDLRRAIGAISMNFARFETALACAVGFLVNPEHVRIGLILTAGLSFKARLAAFSNLYSEHLGSSPTPDDLECFLSEAHRLEDERNTFIHSFYWSRVEGNTQGIRIKVTAKERKGLNIHFKRTAPTDLKEVAEKLWHIPDRLDELMFGIDDRYSEYQARFYGMFQE